MKTITNHRARIVDIGEIFKPQISPLIHEAGKHHHSVELSDHTTLFAMRVYYNLCKFLKPYVTKFMSYKITAL